MSTNKSFSEKTSADDKSIGFEYQYYYFLDKLLNLKVGQSAGLEVKDDVHTQLNEDLNILYQLKHTVKTNATGAPIALTQLDSDLWKTLFNWSQIISDSTQNRTDIATQLQFIKNTEFHLVSNKTLNKTNEFLKKIEQFQLHESKFEILSKHIETLELKTQDDTIKGYIQAVRKLAPATLEQFFRNIRFELALDDIIKRVKRSILEKAVDSDRVDHTFERLDSNVKMDNFIAIKRGEAIIISFEQFMQRYRKVFEDSRNKKLTHRSFKPDLPNDIWAQLFIKRLIEISDLTLNDKEIAIDYTTQKLQIATHLRQWVQSGELVTDDVEALHEDVLTCWKNEFREAFRDCANHEIVKFGRNILVILRREKFQLGNTQLNTAMSNGELYYLSDSGSIGWHKDWSSNGK